MSATSLLPTVQAAFGSAAKLGYNGSTAAHDIYEGYLLTLFLAAASSEGWTWQVLDGHCRPTRNVVFRCGPGRLYSRKFTHIHLTRVGKADLEAHIGVKVKGKTRYVNPVRGTSHHILHEFDLLVLTVADADRYRARGEDPDHSSVVVHAEAKYYGGNLPLPLGRAMVGLSVDCDLAGKSVLVTNKNGYMVEQLIKGYGVGFKFLVSPSGKGESHLVSCFKRFLRAAP